jgi:hypothetical protein
MAKKARASSKVKWDVERDDGPLVIYIGRQGDGGVYRLGPWSKKRIADAHPQARRVPFLHIGYYDVQDFEKLQGPFWPSLVQLLTGLTAEQLAALGGVDLYEVSSESTWHVPLPVPHK